MTNPQDIIGIVKEYQANMTKWLREPEQWRGMIANHSERIAQALLIAVEELEDIGRYKKGSLQDGGRFPNDPTLEARHAQMTLSRIRSLPTT